MATETRTFINVSDLAGIEFECRNCGAKILYPIKRHYEPLPENCPSCSAPLFDNNPGLPADQPQVVELVQKTLTSLHNISDTPAVRAQVRLYLEEASGHQHKSEKQHKGEKKTEDLRQPDQPPAADRKAS